MTWNSGTGQEMLVSSQMLLNYSKGEFVHILRRQVQFF